MDTPQIILAIGSLFVLIGLMSWALDRAGTLGEDDPEQVYPDQDGEATPARHQWVNAGAKAPHVE
jgi:hypothetical protein